MRRTIFVLMIFFLSTLTGVISSNYNPLSKDGIDVEYFNGFEDLNDKQRQSFRDIKVSHSSSNSPENSSNIVFDRASASLVSGEGIVKINSIVVDSNNNVYFIGNSEGAVSFGPFSFQEDGIVLGKMDRYGNWIWVNHEEATAASTWVSSDLSGSSILLDVNDNIVVTGSVEYGTRLYINNTLISGTIPPSGNPTPAMFVAKLDSYGQYQWVFSQNYIRGISLVSDSNADYYVMGEIQAGVSNLAEFNGTRVYGNQYGQGHFLAKLNSSGSWQWALGGDYYTSSAVPSESIVIDSNNDIWIATSSWSLTNLFGCSNYTQSSFYVIKLNSSGSCLSVHHATITLKQDYSITTNSLGDIYVTGSFTNYANFGNTTLYTSSTSNVDVFVAKISSSGNWSWAISAGGSMGDYGSSIGVTSDDLIYVSGIMQNNAVFGNITISTNNQYANLFIGQLDSNGTWNWVVTAGGPNSNSDRIRDIAVDSNDNILLTGYFLDSAVFGLHYFPKTSVENNQYRGFIVKLCTDSDGDYYNDCNDEMPLNPTQYQDSDGDGYGDDQSNTSTQIDNFTSNPTQWKDSDGDGYGDNQTSGATQVDDFIYEPTQWSDLDNDGYGDNPLGFEPDACPYIPGDSTEGLFLGCRDTDGDKWADTIDVFPIDYTQHNDSDGDGYGDNISGNYGDDCPNISGTSTKDRYGCIDQDNDGWSNYSDSFSFDSSQWNDTDDDGFGDELNGFQGDSCPNEIGNSTRDRFGCADIDNDGWSDEGDDLPSEPTQWRDRDGDGYGDNQDVTANRIDQFPADGTQWNDTDMDGHGDNPYGTEGDWFPNDPTRWQDSDRDGVADEDDAFPNELTQSIDTDGDGYGDNQQGDRPDAFPNDPFEWKDSDDDGLGDNADMFPYDPTQIEDRDGDGMGDNPMGIGADKFPDDATQWGDIDGDGYGDNPLGNNPDLFITDATQWADRDGDGYGDNPQGRLYDLFPDNPTQWEDADEDGLGDNQSGTDADPFLNDFDNDGFNDSIDILPKLASPGDLDADGCLDEDDAFPENGQECVDTDGDGIGNNGDSDDDGDGWTDADEERLGTDSLSSSSKPVDSFEIVIPGTSVGLGAWDLIGMFGGIPLFVWIAFGFATRNGRCQRYEELLNSANSRDELEQVALRWEYSLMLRMLGPHQGIRLERLRAELDDKFENTTYDETEIGYDQTNIVENEGKDIPPINESITEPTKETAATSIDESGYEWFKQGEENWYRPAGSSDDWFKFEN